MKNLVSFNKYSMLLFTLEILDSLHCAIVLACRHGREKVRVQLLVYWLHFKLSR